MSMTMAGFLKSLKKALCLELHKSAEMKITLGETLFCAMSMKERPCSHSLLWCTSLECIHSLAE